MVTFITVIGLLGVAVGWMVAGTILRGWVLSILWKWFMVSAFGLPVLSVAAAIGVSIVVSLMTFQYVYTEDNRSEGVKIASGLGVSIGAPLLILGMAWIIKQFL